MPIRHGLQTISIRPHSRGTVYGLLNTAVRLHITEPNMIYGSTAQTEASPALEEEWT